MLKEIRDIGIAAYLVMHEYKLRDKKDKSFLFEVVSDENKKFEDLKISYLSVCFFSHFGHTKQSLLLINSCSLTQCLVVFSLCIKKTWKLLQTKKKPSSSPCWEQWQAMPIIILWVAIQEAVPLQAIRY
jgi:hypothetical protein